MNVEILSHDVSTGKARIKFSHLDVVHESDYDLTLVIPGTKTLLAKLNMEFTEEIQLKALDSLTKWVQRDIEAGTLKNKIEGIHPDDVAQPTTEVQP